MKKMAFGTKIFLSLCVPIIGACSSGQQGLDGKSGALSVPAQSGTNAAQDHIAYVPVGGPTNKPLGLGAGHSVSASFTATKFGSVSAVAIFIGNYANTSDGELQVKLCQAEVCSTGASSLLSSRDNTYFRIPLKSTLTVRKDGGPINFVLSRLGGSKPFVIWGYPATDPAQAMKFENGASSGKAAKVGLVFVH